MDGKIFKVLGGFLFYYLFTKWDPIFTDRDFLKGWMNSTSYGAKLWEYALS
jgi:hypothetical protein